MCDDGGDVGNVKFHLSVSQPMFLFLSFPHQKETERKEICQHASHMMSGRYNFDHVLHFSLAC